MKIEIFDSLDQIQAAQEKEEYILNDLLSAVEENIKYLKDNRKEAVLIDADLERVFIYLNILNDYRNAAKEGAAILQDLISQEE